MTLELISEPPAELRRMKQYQVGLKIYVFDPNECVPENRLHSGGLNPGPLNYEPSALNNRPWQHANSYHLFAYFC
jgi:hypothetical protein